MFKRACAALLLIRSPCPRCANTSGTGKNRKIKIVPGVPAGPSANGNGLGQERCYPHQARASGELSAAKKRSRGLLQRNEVADSRQLVRAGNGLYRIPREALLMVAIVFAFTIAVQAVANPAKAEVTGASATVIDGQHPESLCSLPGATSIRVISSRPLNVAMSSGSPPS